MNNTLKSIRNNHLFSSTKYGKTSRANFRNLPLGKKKLTKFSTSFPVIVMTWRMTNLLKPGFHFLTPNQQSWHRGIKKKKQHLLACST